MRSRRRRSRRGDRPAQPGQGRQQHPASGGHGSRPGGQRSGQGARRGGSDRPGKPARPAGREVFMEGRLQVKARFGFLLSEDPAVPDVFIGPATLGLAMPGDRVRARVRNLGGRPEGDIVEVLERARATVVGIYERTPRGGVLLTEPGAPPVRVAEGGPSVKPGQAAVLRVTRWPTASQPAEGVVAEVLGFPDDPGVDMTLVIKKYEAPEAFPPEVLEEAEAYGAEVRESAAAGRETFFHLPVVTIDGADAKDFDDALSVERLPGGGWRLGVHIADVAHYVREGSALDEEALKRATSVYLPGRVVPMLPPRLSDDLCSLRPDRVRLTLSCVMDLASDGRVTAARVAETAIRSARRFTYEEVEEILRDRGTSGASPEIVSMVRELARLARLIRARRVQRGGLDMDFPEAKLVLDDQGRPLDSLRRERLESHRLVEDCMLQANESVAELMKAKPFLYRVHETPDPAKLDKLARTLKAYGLPVPPDFASGRPRVMQKVLESAAGRPEAPMIRMMALRSFKQAVYSPENAGHYGLGSACYTHFTSPIRRYPDLCIHRIIKEDLARLLTPERTSRWNQSLPEIALRASRRERVAQEMEREAVDVKRVRLMRDKVGKTFDGVVSGAAAFGFFVLLDDVFVEGLVRTTALTDDSYAYDEVRGALRGRRHGRAFRMGQKVRVRLVAADAIKRQLEFELASDAPPRDKPRDQGRARTPERPKETEEPKKRPWTWRRLFGLADKDQKKTGPGLQRQPSPQPSQPRRGRGGRRRRRGKRP